MTPIPLPIRTLYDDLVQQVHAPVERTGSLYARRLKGTEYVYLKAAVGTTRRDLFIGRADDAGVSDRMAAIREENGRASERRKIVATLRKAGVPVPTRSLGAVLDAVADAGLFRQAVLVGTAAYQCYPPLVGFALPSASLTTQDADFATASLALSADTAGETMETILKRADASFRPVPGLDPAAPASRFRSADGFFVDLLTPELRRSDLNPMPLEKLGAGAVPLQHLNWLIEDNLPAAALFKTGVPVRLPLPARYAVHKLIVAQKRTADRGKRRKDLAQADALIRALRVSDPWSLKDAYEDACARGAKGWREPIARSLRELDLAPESFSEPA